jgi:hypothetical protein
MRLHHKQTIALDLLEDKSTEQIFFGGAAGGGKSALGCYWQLKNRIKYPETRGLIGRSKLKALKDTTLKTFFEIAKMQGLKRDTHFKYHQQQSLITFANGSEIMLKDLFAYPSDPNFDAFGSLEITDAFIDETPQIVRRAKNVLKSRIRYRLDDFGLCQKILLVGNPSKNWVYQDFYKPHKEGTIESEKAFIQSLLSDNPYISKQYRKGLMSLSKVDKQRLLYGNWEYEDDDNAVMSFEAISDLWTNDFVEENLKERYLTADIALHGSDRFVIGLWHGWVLKKVFVFKKLDADQVERKLKEIANNYNVPRSHITYDADGLGTFLRGYLRGAIPFNNGSKALRNENYQNLKTQCAYKFGEKVNDGEIYIEDNLYKDHIIEELEQIKKEDVDRDGKMKITPKQKVKEILGRSPDFSDMCIMRMIFELRSKSSRSGRMALT